MSARVRFGQFEFDPGSGELWKSGRPLRLQPQPARVLALLIERPGEVVSRDDLRQHIWRDGTVVDFDRGLNFSIAQIRSALGDAAEIPRFIETLPRRGYRFIAPVEPAFPQAGSREAADGAPVRTRRWAWVVASAVVLGAAAVAVLLIAMPSRPSPVRVAVVPFDNETGQDSFDAIARGVADATVARLASGDRVDRLSVIGNSAALSAPRGFRDIKTIGERVDAEYVVLAQMKSDAEGVRLIAHLIRVRDEAHVWANTFDRPSFTLEVQAEIAGAIADAVYARLVSG